MKPNSVQHQSSSMESLKTMTPCPLNIVKRFIALLLVLPVLTLGWFSPPALASDQGAVLFETHCAGCHLKGGNIIRRGKNLQLKTLEKNGYATPEAIADIIANGKNNMSAFSDRLNATEIAELSAYVLDQAQQGWP